MNIAVFAVLAIVFYLAAAMHIARGIVERARSGSAATRPAPLLALLALALHAAVLYQGILTSSGLNLGIFNTVSLVAWVVAGVVVVASLVAPVENLALVLLPSAGLGIGLELLFPNERLLLASAPLGLRLHVVLSVTAYSLLTIAALQAVVIAVEERLLRTRRYLAAMQLLPPLQIAESLMFQFIIAGFFLLSLGLLSGLMFVEDIFAQHLVHKTVLSFVAWCIFAVLLWGRYRFGWRGRTALRYMFAGFVALLLAYFGTKVVLELILHRV